MIDVGNTDDHRKVGEWTWTVDYGSRNATKIRDAIFILIFIFPIPIENDVGCWQFQLQCEVIEYHVQVPLFGETGREH